MAQLRKQMATAGILSVKEANALQANSDEIKVVSFDSKTGTKSFINEKPNATDFGLEIRNDTVKSIFVAIVAGLGAWKVIENVGKQDFFPGSFMDGDDLLSRIGADCVLADGVLYEDEENNQVVARTRNSNRKINELTKYAAKTPFRFTKFVMSSYKASTGTPESSNFNNSIKSLWLSPFEDTVETEFSLRTIVRDRFQAQLLELDFVKDAPMLKPIMSDEHVMVLQINPDTILNINAHIGARLSNAQYFYRMTKEADKLVRPLV